MIHLTIEKQLIVEKQRVADALAKLQRQASDIDYLSMMTGIDLEAENNDEA